MTWIRASVLLVLMQLVATIGMAQEYGRASGGAVDVLTKRPKTFDGTFGFSLGSSSSLQSLKGYDATVGGTMFDGRLSFFGSAQRYSSWQTPVALSTQFTQRGIEQGLAAKVSGQLGERQNIIASFHSTQQPELRSGTLSTGVLPSSFLSLHYTAVVSSNMFFDTSFRSSSTKRQVWALPGVGY